MIVKPATLLMSLFLAAKTGADYQDIINANDVWNQTSLSRTATEILIGGLFPITNAQGVPQTKGIQRAEAFKCAISRLSNSSRLAGVKIHYHIEDDKDDANTGLFKSLNFINTGVLAVVGASSSSVTDGVAKFLSPFNLPLVSYASSSPALSDTVRYPTFIRTVPSDTLQATAMAELANSLDWEIVAALGTDDTYGSYGLSAFRDAATARNIKVVCPTTVIPSQTSNIPEKFISCLSQSKAKVVLLFMNEAYAANAIASLSNSTAFTDDMVFIASDSWATSNLVSLVRQQGVSAQVLKGTVGVIQNPGDLSDFRSCLSNLNPSNNNYPEFVKYWQTRFSCSVDPTAFNGTLCPTTGPRTSKISCVCNGQETLANDALNNKAGLVMDSVLVIVNALNMIQNYCNELKDMPGFPDQTICSTPTISGLQLLTTMQYLQLTGYTGELNFKGTDRQRASYDILQFDGSSWNIVGSYDDSGDLSLETSALVWKDGSIPVSRVIPDLVENSDIAAIIVYAVSSVGIVASIALFIYFYIHRNNRVLRKSSPLFCMLMLVGNLLVYVSMYLWSGPQSSYTCQSKVWIGLVGFAILMGNLLAPTFRIYRIFSRGLRFKRLLNSDLFVISALVLAGEVTLLLIWTLVDPVGPVIKQSLSNELYTYEACDGSISAFQTSAFAVIVVYNGILLILGSILSYLTRKVYAEFNDSKFIGASMYNFTFILAVILPLYLTTSDDVGSVERRYIMRSLAMLFANTFTMLVLFAPKVRHVYKELHPDTTENVIRSGQQVRGISGIPLEKRGTIQNAVSSKVKNIDNAPTVTPKIQKIVKATDESCDRSMQQKTRNILSQEDQLEADVVASAPIDATPLPSQPPAHSSHIHNAEVDTDLV